MTQNYFEHYTVPHIFVTCVPSPKFHSVLLYTIYHRFATELGVVLSNFS